MANPDLMIHSDRMAQTSQCCGLPVREDVLFSNKNGEDKPALHKRAEQLLKPLAEPLRQVLLPGEAILYCAKAQSPLSSLEQFLTGWWSQVMTRVVLVATNRRLLQFSVTGNGTWKRSLSSVSWGDVAKVKSSRFIGGHYIVHYKNGTKSDYWGVKWGEVPKLQAIADKLLPASTAEATATQAPVSVCPECWQVLTPRVYECSKCGLVFKNEKTLVKMGVFVPGGAYFYTGFVVPGVLTAIGELIVLFEILVLAVAAYAERGKPEYIGYFITMGIFAFAYGFETIVTIYHCRRVIRQFVPTSKHRRPELVASSASATGF